jgi:hypothetical protein
LRRRSGLGFRGLGIEGDHLAAWVALENSDHRLRAEPQRAADEAVLGEAGRAAEIYVDVRPEASLVEGGAGLMAEVARGLEG